MNSITIAVALSLLVSLGCDVSTPVEPDDLTNPQSTSVGKATEDHLGGGLQGIWLDVEYDWDEEFLEVVHIDSLIFTPRDDVADELDYRFIRMALREVDASACVVERGLDIDDHIDCLVQNASEQLEFPLEGGRIRIQSDNGRGHIILDRWVEWFYDYLPNERGEVIGTDWVYHESNTIKGNIIFLDQQVVIWDSLLLLPELEGYLGDIFHWSSGDQFTRSRGTDRD